MEEYSEITEMGEAGESVIEKKKYIRKPNKTTVKNQLGKWNRIQKYPVHVLELKIEKWKEI